MSIAKPLVYIDTNLFAYKLIRTGYKDKLIKPTDKFFQDIQNGTYLAITSTFTETEYRSVVKRMISKAKNRQLTKLEEDTAMNDFHTFNKKMGIGYTDSDVISYNNNTNQIDIFSVAGNTILQHVSPYYHDEQWRSIGGMDAIILNLALRSGANMIATFDNGFRGLSHPLIQALIIPMVYSI